MQYPGHVQSTIDLLDSVLSSNLPADVIAQQFFRRRKNMGSRDRKIISEFAFQIIRHREQLNWWAERLNLYEDDARVLVLIGLRALLKIDMTAYDRLFTDRPQQPEELDAKERRALQVLLGETFDHPDMPEHVRLNCPQWIYEAFKAQFGDELASQVEALNMPAPLDLRVNQLQSSREGVLRMFDLMGWKAEATPYSPLGIRLERGRPLSDSDMFKKGLVEVQDEASQIAGLLCDAQPGMAVLDLCAGAGGKSLALAGTMQNKGRLVLMDVADMRLAKAKERLRRAGVSNYEIRVLDAQNQQWLKRQAKRFDRVLVDVPCSGTGTWRRNPDLKWRFSETDLSELVDKQRQIMEVAATLVKPGGYLIYSTCSLLEAEDEDQINGFLQAHEEFELVPTQQLWSKQIGSEYVGTSDMLKLTPYQHNTDGFFVAILRRRDSKGA